MSKRALAHVYHMKGHEVKDANIYWPKTCLSHLKICWSLKMMKDSHGALPWLSDSLSYYTVSKTLFYSTTYCLPIKHHFRTWKLLPDNLFTFLVAITSVATAVLEKNLLRCVLLYHPMNPRKSTEQQKKIACEGLYDGPDPGRNWTKDDIRDKARWALWRTGLGKVRVNGDVATLSERAPERRH